MPRASEELRLKWKNDQQAVNFLKSKGYIRSKHFYWHHPDVKSIDDLDDEEYSAIVYLITEWDYGGLVHQPVA